MSTDDHNEIRLDEDLRLVTISEVNPVVITDESCIYPQTRSLITPSSAADGCYIRLPQTLHRIDQNTNAIQQEQLPSTPKTLASNGKYVVVACPDAIQCFSLPSLEPRGSLPVQNAQSVGFCLNNLITIVTANSSLVLRNIQTGAETPSSPITNGRVKCCAVGKNKTILAVGMEDSCVEILKLGSDGSTTRVGTVPVVERQDTSCTYVAWWGHKTLAVGYEYQGDEVALFVIEFENTRTWTVKNTTDLGPVVSFLREENADVHQFLSCVLGYGHIVVVGASLGTELGVVVKDPALNRWEVVDMIEPYALPTFGDDFLYPMGLGEVAQDEFLVALTDGSIRRMKLETDVPAFQLPALLETTEKEACAPDEHGGIPSIVDEDAPVESVFGVPVQESKSAAVPTPSIFGSGAPAFGSGGSGSLSFGSGGSPSLAFASTSTGIPSTAGTFGAGRSPTFSSFGGLPPLGTSRFSIAKPLFGDAPKSLTPAEAIAAKTSTSQEEQTSSFSGLPSSGTSTFSLTKPSSAPPAEPKTEETPKPQEEPPQTKPEPKEEESSKASVAFDVIDSAKKGFVPISRLEDLLDEVGEGLHGDEMDRQAAKLDPEGSGRIHRSAFILWYEDLANDNDDESIDSEEQAERAEEREKAKDAFSAFAGDKGWISKSEFSKVVEKLGSTYTGIAVEYLAIEGKIREESFLEWYVSWLFGDEDDEEEEEEEEAENATLSAPSPVSGGIWSRHVASNMWTCDECSVSNADAVTKCIVCEALRPGFKNVDVSNGQKTEAIESSKIGAGGFSFGGITSSAASNDLPTSNVSSGGFTFPGSSTAETSKAGGGFSFPSSETRKSSGFVCQPGASGPSRAVVAFDSLDTTKAGYLSVDRLEELLDAVGEGLFGEERVNQASKMDPTSSGKITREAFLNWYESLFSKNEDSESDEEGKAEERSKATRIFQAHCSDGEYSIPVGLFPKVVKSLGVGNGSESHSKTMRRLAVDGRIQLSSFLKWYIDWMFEDNDSTDTEGSDDALAEENPSSFGSQSKSSSNIGPGGFSFGMATLSTGRDIGTKSAGGFSFAASTNGNRESADGGFSPAVSTTTSDATGISGGGFTFSTKASEVKPPTKIAPSRFGNKPTQQSFNLATRPAVAFPPVSEGAPKSISQVSRANPKSTNPSFPPVSLTAPKSTGDKPSPSPIPPMSMAAPKPASSMFPPMSSIAPKPAMALSTAAPKSVASPFPPMSLTAPKNSFEKPLASSPFPPMAAIAPKPAKATFPPVPKTAPSPAFPPMAKTAPKTASTLPLAEKKTGFPPVPKTAPSPAFPPMAKTAPKTASTLPLAEKKVGFPPVPKTAPSPAFPPMAKTAPKTASTLPLAEKKIGFPPVPKTAPAPAFPPMAKTAPKTASAFPSASSATPEAATFSSPFTSFGHKGEHKSPASSFGNTGNERTVPRGTQIFGTPRTSSRTPQRLDNNSGEGVTVSAACQDYISIVRQMQAILSASPPQHEDNSNIESFMNDKATLICSTEVLESDLRVLKAKVAELLSTKSDTLRLVSESMVLIENIRKGSNGPDGFESQPLDHRSKTQQRKLYNQAVACKSLVDLVGEKGKLFREGESSEQRVKQSVVTSYNRSLRLAERAEGRRKASQVQVVKTSKHLPSSVKRGSVSIDWKRVENSIQGLSLPRTKPLSLKNRQLPIPGHRLLPPQDNYATPLASRKSPRTLLSPPLQTSARPQWSEETTADQDKFKTMSLRPSSNIRDVTLKEGAESAVLKYGTTVEKFQEASAITEGGSSYFSRRLSPKKVLPVNSPPAKSPADVLPVLPEDNESASKPPGSSFSFGGLGSGLPSLAPKSTPSSTLQPPDDTKKTSAINETIADHNPKHDYRILLQKFYEKYSPSKQPNYDQLLQKYKGKEHDLFSKLATKYNAPNPLTASTHSIATTPQGGNSPVPPFGQTPTSQPSPANLSPFAGPGSQGTNKSPFSNAGTGSVAPSAANNLSPFAGSGSLATNKSPFSNTGPGPTVPNAAPFVASQSTITSQPQTSQFGTPAPISVAAPSQTKTFAGRTAREILTECFKNYNPAKLSNLDHLLDKYRGREEEMIRGLGKKYKFDVAQFGIQAAPHVPMTSPPPAFGQPSPLGMTAPTFGSPAPLGGTAPIFGSPAPLGGNTPNTPSSFGSPPQTTFGSGFASAGATPGFGALANSPGPSFGTPTPFTTPFGAARK